MHALFVPFRPIVSIFRLLDVSTLLFSSKEAILGITSLDSLTTIVPQALLDKSIFRTVR